MRGEREAAACRPARKRQTLELSDAADDPSRDGRRVVEPAAFEVMPPNPMLADQGRRRQGEGIDQGGVG
jgi:hypothetical protein